MPGRTGGLASLERKLQLKFLDQQLLRQALTHRPYAHEHATAGAQDKTRLVALGRAVETTGAAQGRKYGVEVRRAGVRLGGGEGSPRRGAEQAAAKEAIGSFEAARTGIADGG